MSKMDKYIDNAKKHEEMLLEMEQPLKIIEDNSGSRLYIVSSRNLSSRFLSTFTETINNNLQFLLFQAMKRSITLIEIDRKEAIEESKNFMNSHEKK